MKVPEMAYKLPFHSTNATKLIIFHFKLLHRRLAKNDFLNKIGIREKIMIFVPFAEPKKESCFYLFWSFSETFLFLHDLMQWLAKNQIKLKSEI